MNPRKCKKCGEIFITTKYDDKLEMLVNTCDGCGYLWSEYPLDTKVDFSDEALGRSYDK